MNNIKKALSIFVALALLASLSACSSKKGDKGAPTENTPSANVSTDMSADDIMKVYCEVYDITKASGQFLGTNSMRIPRIVFGGNQNPTLEGMVSSLLKSLFENQTDKPLPPSEQAESLDTCLLTGDDVESATYADNKDGTATINFVPKGVHFPQCEKDPQGKTFNLFKDLKGSIGSVKQITWAQGTIDENLDVYYHDGYVTCTFDTKSKMMTSAEYVSRCDLTLNHANFMGVIKDKSVEITLEYIENFPS